MRNYMDPEMKISQFSVTDIVTTSGVNEDPTKTNAVNAQTYLTDKGIAAGDVLGFKVTF